MIGRAYSRFTYNPSFIAGVCIALFGAWFIWQATLLREGPGYAVIGPRVFPLIVGIGFAVSGLTLLISALRPPPSETQHSSDVRPPEADGSTLSTQHSSDWSTLLAMAALLAGYVVMFRPVGFLITSAAFLVGGAWALGSRNWLRDVVVGVALSVVTFAVFTRLLGLELPAGPLEEPLRALVSISAEE